MEDGIVCPREIHHPLCDIETPTALTPRRNAAHKAFQNHPKNASRNWLRNKEKLINAKVMWIVKAEWSRHKCCPNMKSANKHSNHDSFVSRASFFFRHRATITRRALAFSIPGWGISRKGLGRLMSRITLVMACSSGFFKWMYWIRILPWWWKAIWRHSHFPGHETFRRFYVPLFIPCFTTAMKRGNWNVESLISDGESWCGWSLCRFRLCVIKAQKNH